MSESDTNSEDSFYTSRYHYKILELSDDRNKLESIEYLKNFILNVEKDLKGYIWNQLYDQKNKNANINEILSIIYEKKRHHSHKIEVLDTIYNNAIFGFNYHKQEELLLCGLRILFSFPTYFIEIDSEKQDTLINTLIQLILTKKEPVQTHAIKCLLMAAYIFTNKRLKIKSFQLLIDFLIRRLFTMLDFNAKNILIPVVGLDYHSNEVLILGFDESLNRLVDKKLNKLQIKYFDVLDFFVFGVHISGNTQIFYYMALLKNMVYHLEVSKLIENVLLLNILYSCINVAICKIDNVIILALKIILTLVDHPFFLSQFLKTNGVERICHIPYCLSSSQYASLILSKIIEITALGKKLIKNKLNLVINYGISSLGCLNPKKSCKIIISLFCDPEYYEIFINQKGIKLILANVNKNKAFIDMKNVNSSYKTINLEYLNILEEIKKLLIVLLLHISYQILYVTPIKKNDLTLEIKFDKINYNSYDILLAYWENEGGFNHKIEFFEELLEVEKFEVIVSILRMTYQYIMKPFKLEIYKDLMYFLKFMSLYHRSKALFIHSFDPYPKQFNKGNSLILLFRSITEQNYYVKYRQFNFEFIPFQVFHNLLVSCFPNFETCKRVLKLENYLNIKEHDSDTFGLQTDEVSKLFMDSLINNMLIYNILNILPNMKLSLTIKIYAIKCLLMLLTRKLSVPIVSVMQGDFINKFLPTLNMIINSGNFNIEIRSFLIYSISLIYKLYHYTYFKSINNISFSTSTNNDLNKNRTLENLFLNDENSLGQLHHRNFLIFKDCIDSIKKNEKSKEKLCSELIHLLFSINLFSKAHFESSKIYLSYDYGINFQISTCTKGGLRYKTRKNFPETIYKKFNKVTNYFDNLNNKYIYDAKLLTDDRIVWTSPGGISHISSKYETYSESMKEIYYIDDSYNSEFIIGCGLSYRPNSRFTNIWKYNPLSSEKLKKPKKIYHDTYYSRITNDNFKMFGIARNLTAKMIDIETASVVKKFYNKNFTRYPLINSVAISDNYNHLLFNGDLFCTRNGKLIYSFPNFNQHISGIFINSDTRILINCELWDLRTTKLVDRIDDLENFIIKKTYNDDILLAIEKCPYYKVCHMEDHFYKWRVHFAIYGRKLKLYNINTFSSMKVIDSKKDIAFANISRDCTKITFGEVEENHGGACSSFKLISIGDKTHTSSD